MSYLLDEIGLQKMARYWPSCERDIKLSMPCTCLHLVLTWFSYISKWRPPAYNDISADLGWLFFSTATPLHLQQLLKHVESVNWKVPQGKWVVNHSTTIRAQTMQSSFKQTMLDRYFMTFCYLNKCKCSTIRYNYCTLFNCTLLYNNFLLYFFNYNLLYMLN